jgi:hypothetical protein
MDMLDDVEFQVAKLELGTNDILVVQSARPLTSVMAAELRAQLEHRLGFAGRVMAIEPGMKLSIVSKSSIAPVAEAKSGGQGAGTQTAQGAGDGRRGGAQEPVR